ncbi:MAG: hypothetical protein ACE5E1_06480 [Phycisphaerae bacterium]
MDEHEAQRKLTAGQRWLLMENLGNLQSSGFRRKRRLPAWAYLLFVLAAGIGAGLYLLR